jgi:hypothetical protein
MSPVGEIKRSGEAGFGAGTRAGLTAVVAALEEPLAGGVVVAPPVEPDELELLEGWVAEVAEDSPPPPPPPPHAARTEQTTARAALRGAKKVGVCITRV